MKIFHEESHFSNIVNIHTNYTSTLCWCFHWIKVRDTEVCGVNPPKWIQKIKIKSENLNSKFKIWYKIEIQAWRFFFRFFNFDFSIFNVEFIFFSLLQRFSKCAYISNFSGNIFLLYEHCLWQSSSNCHFEQTRSFSIT